MIHYLYYVTRGNTRNAAKNILDFRYCSRLIWSKKLGERQEPNEFPHCLSYLSNLQKRQYNTIHDDINSSYKSVTSSKKPPSNLTITFQFFFLFPSSFSRYILVTETRLLLAYSKTQFSTTFLSNFQRVSLTFLLVARDARCICALLRVALSCVANICVGKSVSHPVSFPWRHGIVPGR